MQFVGDIKFYYLAHSADTLGPADIVPTTNDLEQDAGFETMVLILLFSDSRARSATALKDKSGTRKGFWGSALLGFELGSERWLLERSNLTQTTVEAHKQIDRNALQILLTDKIAEEITVDAYIYEKNQLNTNISIKRPDGVTVNFGYYVNWEQQLIGGL